NAAAAGHAADVEGDGFHNYSPLNERWGCGLTINLNVWLKSSGEGQYGAFRKPALVFKTFWPYSSRETVRPSEIFRRPHGFYKSFNWLCFFIPHPKAVRA
ncbi:hypothetical protein, partial [Neisseria dentiae]|uniref:hypothetical protein n=1 Tax=Neisseria dentiae TaxID=194197 RepID=UPI0035A16E99